MTGPEHYQAAERLVAEARRPATDRTYQLALSAEAQVHATLALAAATALNPQYGGPRSYTEWYDVAGSKPVDDEQSK